jgi:hypothetical protein
MKNFGADKEIVMSSVETFGRWLADRPRARDEEPSIETSLWLDRTTNKELLYLSKRFDVPKAKPVQELVQAAVRDVFKVIPGDPIPNELIPDLHDAGVDPEKFRWFDLDGVAVEEKEEGLQAIDFGGPSEGT